MWTGWRGTSPAHCTVCIANWPVQAKGEVGTFSTFGSFDFLNTKAHEFEDSSLHHKVKLQSPRDSLFQRSKDHSKAGFLFCKSFYGVLYEVSVFRLHFKNKIVLELHKSNV